MVIENGIRCLLKFKHPDYSDYEIICCVADIGKCIQSFQDNCDLNDDDFKRMTIFVSFKPFY